MYRDVYSARPAALSHKTSTPYELRGSTTIITSILTLPSTAHLHTTITIALAAPPSPSSPSFTSRVGVIASYFIDHPQSSYVSVPLPCLMSGKSFLEASSGALPLPKW
ncbi:hypothetical protein E2C01_052643 [Portunus trituberculatus]|uniref:Uncharacterized protein n=1 Tax=Portunus trituberculatus TaxID=210409 RepID=A0A5B7GM81_PORTR|nr:hypothetical protein [Portunus trituberculatus]